MQSSELHKCKTVMGKSEQEQANKQSINYNRFQSEMRDRSDSSLQYPVPTRRRQQVANTKDLQQAVNNELITPWEINTFTIQEIIKVPNHHEETFPEGLLRRTAQQPQKIDPSQHNNSEQNVGLIQKGACRNLLKFVIKLLRDYMETVKECFGAENQSSFQQFQRYLAKLFEWHREEPSKHNINQTHLKWLMEVIDEESRLRSGRVRLAIAKILRRRMGKLALQNNRCRSKLIYMNALKVYQLRCCNSITAIRFQSSE